MAADINRVHHHYGCAISWSPHAVESRNELFRKLFEVTSQSLSRLVPALKYIMAKFHPLDSIYLS